jgi:hypothetical protein
MKLHLKCNYDNWDRLFFFVGNFWLWISYVLISRQAAEHNSARPRSDLNICILILLNKLRVILDLVISPINRTKLQNFAWVKFSRYPFRVATSLLTLQCNCLIMMEQWDLQVVLFIFLHFSDDGGGRKRSDIGQKILRIRPQRLCVANKARRMRVRSFSALKFV